MAVKTYFGLVTYATREILPLSQFCTVYERYLPGCIWNDRPYLVFLLTRNRLKSDSCKQRMR